MPPWEFQTPLSLGTPRLLINLPRKWLSQEEWERGEEGIKKVRKKWRKEWKVRTMTASSPGPLWTNKGSIRKEDGTGQGMSLLWPKAKPLSRKSGLYVIWYVVIFRSFEVVGGDSLELPYPTVWPLATGDCWTHERQCNMLKWSYFGYIGLNKIHH